MVYTLTMLPSLLSKTPMAPEALASSMGAGCYVTDGKVQRNAGVRLLRDNVVVFEGKLSSLRHLKDDVKEMAAGYECGMILEGHNDIKEGDIVECYIMEEIPR